MTIPRQTPDLLTWRRVADGLYQSTDGLLQARRVAPGLWASQVRDELEADWRPAATFRDGRACLWQSLSVAQHEARRAAGARS